jgi:hypothetical protein
MVDDENSARDLFSWPHTEVTLKILDEVLPCITAGRLHLDEPSVPFTRDDEIGRSSSTKRLVEVLYGEPCFLENSPYCDDEGRAGAVKEAETNISGCRPRRGNLIFELRALKRRSFFEASQSVLGGKLASSKQLVINEFSSSASAERAGHVLGHRPRDEPLD